MSSSSLKNTIKLLKSNKISIKELNQEWPGMIRPKLEWITDKV